MFEALVENALVVDIGLAVLAVEIATLYFLARRYTGGSPPADLISTLIAGAMLMLALRFAIVDGAAVAIIAFMTLAGLAHGVGIYQRLKRTHGS